MNAVSACATCRFFLPDHGLECFDTEDDGPPDFGNRTTDHGACARIEHGNDGRPFEKVANELALVTDGSGYAARLRVLPAFGCVLWEVKP